MSSYDMGLAYFKQRQNLTEPWLEMAALYVFHSMAYNIWLYKIVVTQN